MNGVTILNSYESLTNFGSILLMNILCTWFLVAAIVALFALLKCGCDSWKKFTILVVCVVLFIVCGYLIPEDKYETHYQVTVDNSVSMNKFQDKYEIIEVEGKIYTVRERVE